MRILLMILFVVALFSSQVLAQECVDYGDYFHPVGELGYPDWDTVRDVNSLTTSGNYLFAPTHTEGLQVIDISDPGTPQIIGSVETPGTAINVAIWANYAFVTDGDFQVIDFSNPENPQLVGSVETPGYTRGVVVEGNLAYVADGDFGLQVIDISILENPQLISGTPMESPASGVAVDENLLYLACNNSLEVIDITNPQFPQVIGSIQTEHYSSHNRVVIEGNYAYFTEVFRHPYTGGVMRAYLMIVNISNPENPQLLSSVDLGRAISIVVSGRFVFASGCGYEPSYGDGGYQVKIIDISDHQTPEIVYSTEYNLTMGRNQGVAYSDGFLYAMTSEKYLTVYNVSNPESVPVVGSMDAPDRIGSMAVTDNHLVMTIPPPYPGNSSSVLIVDITDPLNTQITGSVNTPGSARDMVAFGDYAYVADGDFGLQVVDISAPTSPEIVGSVEIPGSVNRVAEFSHHTNNLYVGDGENLHVIDISDPSHPQLTGSVGTPWTARCIAVEGDYAYVGGDSFLQIFDVANAQAPYLITSFEIAEGDVLGVATEGNYVYVTWVGGNADAGLKVIDCSIPGDPQIVSAVTLGVGYAFIQRISDGLAYICLSDFSHCFDIAAIDITAPYDPHFLGGTRLTATSTYHFSDIAVYGDYIFARIDSTLVTIPNHCFATTGIEDNSIDPEPIDTPMPLVNLSVYPNPFNPRTTVFFTLNYPQVVELSIYDMAGKRVAVLADGTFEAGGHSIEWQGQDQQGQAVSSGSYLVKMSTEERVTTRKMTLIR